MCQELSEFIPAFLRDCSIISKIIFIPTFDYISVIVIFWHFWCTGMQVYVLTKTNRILKQEVIVRIVAKLYIYQYSDGFYQERCLVNKLVNKTVFLKSNKFFCLFHILINFSGGSYGSNVGNLLSICKLGMANIKHTWYWTESETTM